jgi:N-terminal domain of NWD NACHT-NTPase
VLEDISVLIRKCTLREETYVLWFEDGKCSHKVSKKAQISYRAAIKDVYNEILKFEAKAVCFYESNTAVRLLEDSVKWDNWDDLSAEIKKKNATLENLETTYQTLLQQDHWNKVENAHTNTLNSLSLIAGENKRTADLIAQAQNSDTRRNLLEWLKKDEKGSQATIKPEATLPRSKTGHWLVQDPDFLKWRDSPNSCLWLHGKGTDDHDYLADQIIDSILAGSGKSVLR